MTVDNCEFHLLINKKKYWFIFSLSSADEAHIALQKVCEELKQKLNTMETDKKSQYLKMTTEIDDLNRTKTILEERLIELIRSDLSLLQLSAKLRLSVQHLVMLLLFDSLSGECVF